jgi:hypothetical protein
MNTYEANTMFGCNMNRFTCSVWREGVSEEGVPEFFSSTNVVKYGFLYTLFRYPHGHDGRGALRCTMAVGALCTVCMPRARYPHTIHHSVTMVVVGDRY